jgi:hypothetical protein
MKGNIESASFMVAIAILIHGCVVKPKPATHIHVDVPTQGAKP